MEGCKGQERQAKGWCRGRLQEGPCWAGHICVRRSYASLPQGNSSSNTRDMYVPNPSCKDFPKYEWIGQLMGAALRSKEILVRMAEPPWPARGLGRGCCVSGRGAALR